MQLMNEITRRICRFTSR